MAPKIIVLLATEVDGLELRLKDPYIALNHAVTEFNYSRTHLLKLVNDGTIRSVKLCGTTLLYTEDMEDFAAGRIGRRGGNGNRRRDLE